MKRTFLFLIILVNCLNSIGSAAVRPTIYVFDMEGVSSAPLEVLHDMKHAVYCLQGLVNRTAPRLFVLDDYRDVVWLTRLRETDGLCEGWPVKYLQYSELWSTFEPYINGLVVYDHDVISTSLAATTAAGVEGGLAVRKDTASGSVYNDLKGLFPILIDMENKFTGSGMIWQSTTPSTGSAKCDAYIWAKEKYLDTGMCDTTVLMYTLDLYGLHTGYPRQLENLDYAVAKKGFCFELSPWGDEVASDDPSQPLGTDLNTFKAILHSCNEKNNYQKMIKFCGFINWDFKYTNWSGHWGTVGGKHEPVATEWELASLLSAYNAYMEGDAPHPNWVVNSSFYAGLTAIAETRRYVQNPAPTYDEMVERGFISNGGGVVPGNYIMIGMGDYDQASWVLYRLGTGLYDEANRGSVPCSWAINPNAIDRAYVAMDYMFRNKTEKDYFMAWDSGVGYVNPTSLYGSRVPSNYESIMPVYQKTCRDYYRIFDYSITGWLLNGFARGGRVDAATVSYYAPFSGDGVGLSHEGGLNISCPSLVSNVVAIRRDGPDSPDLSDMIDYSSGVHFAWYRSILQNAGDMKAIQDGLSGNQHLVDAYTFYYLLRYYLGGSNHHRATWVSDNIPRIMEVGQSCSVTATVRNDGWDNWSEADSYRFAYAIVQTGMTPCYLDYDSHDRTYIPDGRIIRPSEHIMFNFTIRAPDAEGHYDLYYDMVHDGVTWFRERNNIEWKKTIIVAVNDTDVDSDDDSIPDVIEECAKMLYWHPDDKYECDDTNYLLADDIPGVSIFDWSSQCINCYSDGRDYAVSHILDGSGFNAGNGYHSVAGNGTMWLSTQTDLTPFIVFDLGVPGYVGTVRIWNYNTSGWDAYLLQGVKRINVQIVDEWDNTVEELGEFALEAAPAQDNIDFGQNIIIDRGNVRYIRFDILETQTAGYNAGLSEVRFYDFILEDNTAPMVTAVVDNDYTYVGRPVNLDGTVTDDGNPNPPAATTAVWTKLSGPDTPIFTDNFAVDTAVSFDTAGIYVLRLCACDGAGSGFSDVVINVFETACDAAFADPDVEALITDFNNDCMVDFLDLAYLAQDWLECYMESKQNVIH